MSCDPEKPARVLEGSCRHARPKGHCRCRAPRTAATHRRCGRSGPPLGRGPRPGSILVRQPHRGPSPTYVLRVRLQGRKMVVTMGIVLRAKEVPLGNSRPVQHEWTAPYEEDSLAPHVSHSGYESARICARTKSMISPSLRVVPRRTAEAKAAGPSRSRRLSTRAPIRCASAASNGKAYAEPAAVSAPWSVAAARSARS